ncbi:MAG: biopolymer transporter ExbD [Moraxellaceae bacterium]|jgi:biopolymer transport protein ExbD|nr:biopolymer transporter ExbD [Moraxellaceae bacterium]
MSFGGGLEDEDDVVSEINMTPLVDVMLVLLIIFMLTVPVLTHSVNLELPRAQNTPTQARPDTVVLAVTATGEVYWNQDRLQGDALATRLAATAALAPQPEIHIRGDRQSDYENVLRVMAAAQRAGVQKLGFVTEPGV